jgi:hypothetical protein
VLADGCRRPRSRAGRCLPANRQAPGTAIVTDKGLSGEETEGFFAGPDLALTLIRPARKDEKTPRYFPTCGAPGQPGMRKPQTQVAVSLQLGTSPTTGGPMTGPEHYLEAERLIGMARESHHADLYGHYSDA